MPSVVQMILPGMLIRLAKGFTALVMACLVAACSTQTIEIEGDYPSPLVQKLPFTVGVYFDQALRNHTYTEVNEFNGNEQYIVSSGSSQVELFSTILPSVFNQVVLLDDLEAIENHPELDLVFVPLLEEFQLGLPEKTRLDVFEVWMKYNMRLSEANGDFIADWVMTAYGKSPTETFQSVDAGVQDATNNALRDLAASFTLGFANIPEVKEWLQGTQQETP